MNTGNLLSTELHSKNVQVQTSPRPECPTCGTNGQLLYESLIDTIWSAPGSWNLKRCSQAHCGTLWLDPCPNPKELYKLYLEYYTHGTTPNYPKWFLALFDDIQRSYLAAHYQYSAEGLGWRRMLALCASFHPGIKAWLDQSVMHLPAHKGGRLLDVGCGDGNFLSLMSKLGWSVCGIEPDPVGVQSAVNRGLDVRSGSLENAVFEDDSFDAITLNHVIEHVPDPKAVLSECRRIVKRDGQIVVVTPNADSLLHRKFGRHYLHLDPPRHLQIFTSASLNSLCQQSGLRVLRSFTSMRNSDAVYLASRQIRRYGHYEWGHLGGSATRLMAQFIYFPAAIRHFLSPLCGEELVLVLARD
jgi:methionine biosynthesis protein MetW